MKKILLVTLLAGVWSVSATANANEVGNDYWLSKGAYQVAANDMEDADTHKRLRLNSISKRPYQHRADPSAKQEKWEGATLKNESIGEDGETKTKSNINQFSRRPYMQRNVD